MLRVHVCSNDNCQKVWKGHDPIHISNRKQVFCTFRCRDVYVDAHDLPFGDRKSLQFAAQYFEYAGQQMG